MLAKPHKYSQNDLANICRYSSGKYKEKGNINCIDAEVLAIIYALNSFRIFIISKKIKKIIITTIRTDCEAIIEF